MSVEFPSNSGLVQSLSRILTKRINSVSEKFDGDKFGKSSIKEGQKEVKATFKEAIKTLVESPKFEPIEEYIKNSYPQGKQVANEVTEYKYTLECDVAMRKLQDALDKFVKSIESKGAGIDKILEPIKDLLDPIREFLGIAEGLQNMSLSLDNIVSAVTSLIKLVVWMFAISIMPVIKSVDLIYLLYRELKVDAAVTMIELNNLLNFKCVTDCKYKSDQSKCPVLKKLRTKKCPLLGSLSPIKAITDTVTSTIDLATIPIDTTLELVNSIVDNEIIKKVIIRKYPTITVSQVQEALEKLAKESSYMNQPGTIPQPDVEEETKVDSEAAKI